MSKYPVYRAKGVRVVIDGVELAPFAQMHGRTKRKGQAIDTSLVKIAPRPSWFVRLLQALGWSS